MSVEGGAAALAGPVPKPSEQPWGTLAWARKGVGILLLHPYEMLVAPALVSVALTVALVPLLALGRTRFLVVNAELEVSAPLGAGLTAAFAGWLLVALIAGVTALAAVMVVAGSVVRREPVTAGRALRESLRRLPTLIPPAVICLAVALVPTAVSIGLLALRAPLAIVILVWTVSSLLLSPVLHLLPVAVLERRGVVGALRRTRQVVRRHRTSATLVPLIFTLLPGVTRLLLDQVFGRLPTQAGAICAQVIGTAVPIVVTVAGAGTLAVATLARIDDLADGGAGGTPQAGTLQAGTLQADAAEENAAQDGALHDGAGHRAAVEGTRTARRPWRALALVAAAGVLHAVIVQANPLRLTELTDHPLSDRGFTTTSGQLHIAADGRPFAITDEGLSLSVRACAVPDCADSDLSGQLGMIGFPSTFDSAPLPDGRAVVAAWYDGWDSADRAMRLFTCAAGGCEPGTVRTVSGHRARWLADTGTVLKTSRTTADWRLATAIARRRDGGFLVAYVVPDEERRDFELGLVSCDDLACRGPKTTRLARIPSWSAGFRSRPLDIAVTRDDRVMIAFFNADDHSVTTVACDTSVCSDPTVTEHDDSRDHYSFMGHDRQGISVAIRPGDLPVIAYSGQRSGARLLECRTFRCDVAASTELTETSEYGATPSVAVDGQGRTLVAAYADDPAGEADLVLIACRDTGCGDRSMVRLLTAEVFPGPLDLRVEPDGRSRILWADSGDSRRALGSLRVLTCAEPRCGAG